MESLAVWSEAGLVHGADSVEALVDVISQVFQDVCIVVLNVKQGTVDEGRLKRKSDLHMWSSSSCMLFVLLVQIGSYSGHRGPVVSFDSLVLVHEVAPARTSCFSSVFSSKAEADEGCTCLLSLVQN